MFLKRQDSNPVNRFRWVVCQFDVLQHLRPDSNIITHALNNLPKTLDETYERIFLNVPEYARAFVHNTLKLIYSNREVFKFNISASILLQAAQRTSPELALSSTEYDHSEKILRKLCGCLITVAPNNDQKRFKAYNSSTTLVVSFAHYTVWEFLNSNRIRNSPAALFAVDAESATLDFAEMLILHAVDVKTYSMLVWKSLESARLKCSGILDDDFSLFCIMASIYYLKESGAKILKRDDLTTLVFHLLDPSKPHFIALSRVAKILVSNQCLFEEWTIYNRFWNIQWLADPDLSEVKTLLNLLSTDHSSDLGNKFLQLYNVKDVMDIQLHLHLDRFFNVHSGLGCDGEFQGSIVTFWKKIANHNKF
jgi:hypothetical protein